jgi:hypothetical protein
MSATSSMSWVGCSQMTRSPSASKSRRWRRCPCAVQHVGLGPGPVPVQPVAGLARPITARPSRSSRPPPSMPTTATSERAIRSSRVRVGSAAPSQYRAPAQASSRRLRPTSTLKCCDASSAMASGRSRSAAIRAFCRNCLVDRAAEVRVDQRPELRVLPAAVLGQVVGQLVEHRQAGQLDEAVADVAGDRQLDLNTPDRRLLRLGGDLDHEAVGPGRQRAPDLDEDVRGVGLLGEDVGLVDQDAGRLRAGDDVGVGGLDLQGGAAGAVGDGLQVSLQVEQLRSSGSALMIPLAWR